MFKKSIALAVPALAATALVAASLSGGAVQASSDNNNKAAITKGAKAAKAISVSCTGGVQKKSADRGLAGYVYTTSTVGTPLAGSAFKFKGPKTGLDRVSVNFSALSYASSNYGQIKVLLDGVPMKPSDSVDGSWIYTTNTYQDFGRNYCGHVGKGNHTVRVVFKTNTGGTLYLFDPMLHAEVSE